MTVKRHAALNLAIAEFLPEYLLPMFRACDVTLDGFSFEENLKQPIVQRYLQGRSKFYGDIVDICLSEKWPVFKMKRPGNKIQIQESLNKHVFDNAALYYYIITPDYEELPIGSIGFFLFLKEEYGIIIGTNIQNMIQMLFNLDY
jgi:hypothetical protein